jgi:hypothetical protein
MLGMLVAYIKVHYMPPSFTVSFLTSYISLDSKQV